MSSFVLSASFPFPPPALRCLCTSALQQWRKQRRRGAAASHDSSRRPPHNSAQRRSVMSETDADHDAADTADASSPSPAQRVDGTSLTLCFQFLSLRGLLCAGRTCTAWHASASQSHRIHGASWIEAEERGAFDGADASATGLTLSVFPSPLCACCLEDAEEPGAAPHLVRAFHTMQQEASDRPALTSIEQIVGSRLLRSLRKITLSPSPALVARQRGMLSNVRTNNPVERLAVERHKSTFGPWDAQFKLLPTLQSLVSLRIDLFPSASCFAPKVIARVFAELARTPTPKEDAQTTPSDAASSSSTELATSFAAAAAPASFVPASPAASPLRVLRLLGTGSSHISSFLAFLPALGGCLRVVELGDEWLPADDDLFDEVMARMAVLHTIRLAPRVHKTARRLVALRKAPCLTTVAWPTNWTAANLDALTQARPSADSIHWPPALRLRSLRVEHATLLSRHLAALGDLEELFAIQTALGSFPAADVSDDMLAADPADLQHAAADADEPQASAFETVAEVAAALPKRLVTLHLCTDALSHLSVAAVAAAQCSSLQVLHLSSSSLRLDDDVFVALCSAAPVLRELQLAALMLRSLTPLSLLSRTLRSLDLYEVLLFDQNSWTALASLHGLQSLLIESHVTVDHVRRQNELQERAAKDGKEALLSLQRARDVEWQASDLHHRLSDQLEWMDEDPQRMIRGILSDILSGRGCRPTDSDAATSPASACASSSSAPAASPVCPLLSRWLFNGTSVRNPCEVEAWRPIPMRPQQAERLRVPVRIEQQVSGWVGAREVSAHADLFS